MPFAHLNPGDSTGLMIFFGVLITPFFIGLYYCFRIRATQKWPNTPGTILTSQVDRHYAGSRYGQDIYSYRVNILYEYNVSGLPFRCSRLSTINLILGDKNGSELIVAAYKVGQSVPVYYNPFNPKDAILEKNNIGTIILWMIIDLMVCAILLIPALNG